MFDKFGEFDSAEELNMAAEGLKEEGDIESLKALAVENGLDPEDAEDYADGCTDSLATPLMAAMGKLDVEEKDLQPYEIMQDWVMYIRTRCSEDEAICVAVRRKGKSLRGCIAELLKWSFKNAKAVDKDIMKAAGVSGRCSLGIPGMTRARQLIKEYYLGK